MKNKKTIAISLSALIVTALFAGCGTKKEEGKETQKKSGKTELTVWTRDSTVAAVKSAAEKYNAKQDKVIVNVVEQPASQMADQLSLALSSEEAPDIVSLDCTKVPYFASIGAFADITEKYETLEYAVQTPKALSYIEMCFIWIPIVLCVIIAALTYFYKLDSIRGKMTEELEKRRQNMNYEM